MLEKNRMIMARKIAREIADAANGAFGDYEKSYVMEEPQVTDRILGAIRERIRNRQFNGVVWNVRTLQTSRGDAAEEKRHGADLMGVLDIKIPGYSAKKGFLAQAKKAEPDHPFSSRDWDRLCSQCELMLERTQESFVFVYSRQRKIKIFGADAILGLESKDMFDLSSDSISDFFENHIGCSIGDFRLDSMDIKTLDALADFSVERTFRLSARIPD